MNLYVDSLIPHTMYYSNVHFPLSTFSVYKEGIWNICTYHFNRKLHIHTCNNGVYDDAHIH